MPLEFDEHARYYHSLEVRIAKLEVAMEHVQDDIRELKDAVRELSRQVNAIRTTDFRIMFGAIIAATLGLAGVMAKGFGWL